MHNYRSLGMYNLRNSEQKSTFYFINKDFINNKECGPILIIIRFFLIKLISRAC